MEELK